MNGVPGLLITIHLEQPVDRLDRSLTVFQQFAKAFGQPELYLGT